MPLTLANPPAEAFSLLADPLSKVFRHDWASIVVLRPQPIYASPIQSFLDGKALQDAGLIGWQFLLTDNDTMRGAGEIAVRSDDALLTYSAYQDGQYTRSVVDAIAIASALPAVAGTDYEVRILRLSYVYLYAVWLHSTSNDILIPAAPAPPSVKAFEPYSAEELQKSLFGLAMERFNYTEELSR